MYNCVYTTKLGFMNVVCDDEWVYIVKFYRETPNATKNEKNSISDKVYEQIQEYISGKRKEFDLPLKPQGTQFQRSVWEKLCEIPYGTTATYKDIAERIENPNAVRAVGGANGKNPIWVIIPCHRVIGSNGSMTGYAGGLELKEMLINLEKRKYND